MSVNRRLTKITDISSHMINVTSSMIALRFSESDEPSRKDSKTKMLSGRKIQNTKAPTREMVAFERNKGKRAASLVKLVLAFKHQVLVVACSSSRTVQTLSPPVSEGENFLDTPVSLVTVTLTKLAWTELYASWCPEGDMHPIPNHPSAADWIAREEDGGKSIQNRTPSVYRCYVHWTQQAKERKTWWWPIHLHQGSRETLLRGYGTGSPRKHILCLATAWWMGSGAFGCKARCVKREARRG